VKPLKPLQRLRNGCNGFNVQPKLRCRSIFGGCLPSLLVGLISHDGLSKCGPRGRGAAGRYQRQVATHCLARTGRAEAPQGLPARMLRAIRFCMNEVLQRLQPAAHLAPHPATAPLVLQQSPAQVHPNFTRPHKHPVAAGDIVYVRRWRAHRILQVDVGGLRVHVRKRILTGSTRRRLVWGVL
jgi:hypothetical protein